MRFALFLGAAALGFGGSACKPRTPAASALKADEGQRKDVDAKGEVAAVAKACGNSPGSAFRGVGDGTFVEFSNLKEAPKGPGSGQPHWYETARFDGKSWVLSASLLATTKAECLNTSRVMKTRQFLAALGCSSEDPCGAVASDVCAGDECQLIAAVDFRMPAFGVPNNGATEIALADVSVKCDGAQLTTNDGRPIGKSVEQGDRCEVLRATATNDLVCAWNGKAFQPARVGDGALIGNPDGGLATPMDCRALLIMGRHGSVCAWTGMGLAPFAVAQPDAPIGAPEQFGETLHCMAKTAGVAGGRICAWDGAAVRAFGLATRAPVPELGAFPDYAACFATVARAASARGLEEVQATLRDAPMPKASGAKPAAGLNLAGSGWTWGDCNDPSRAYHLTQRSGSRLICEGKIDTLYSWGPYEKITWLARQSWSGRVTRDGDRKEIFATPSSFATHGYGPYAIRFKLKPTTKFKFLDGVAAYSICDDFSYSEIEDTVAVRYWANGGYTGLDFVLCGLGPVHSWSYGTQGHYDEMNREVTWMNANNYKSYELYVKQNGIDTTFPDQLDGFRFTAQTWTNNLTWHRGRLPGAVYLNPSADNATQEEHFTTAWPNYINPNQSYAVAQQPAVGAQVKSGGSRRFSLTFASGDRQQRDFAEAQMKSIIEVMRSKDRPIECTTEKAVGWLLQKICTTDDVGAVVLGAVFPALEYHSTIQEL